MQGLRIRLSGLLVTMACGAWACDPLPPGTSGQSAAYFCNGTIATDTPCSKAVAVADSVRAANPPAGAAGSKAAATGMVSTGVPGLGAPGLGLGVGAMSSGSDSGAAGKPSSAGGMGGGPASGTAGVGGNGGGAGAAGAGAADPNALQCPNEVCAPLPPPPADAAAMTGGMMFKIVNCCASNGDCGTSLNDAACVRTPDSDPQCPALMAMGFTIPSCCTPDGQCGTDGSAFMMGCTDLATVATMVMGFFDVPPPQPCTPKM